MTSISSCDWCGNEHCLSDMFIIKVKPTMWVDDPQSPWKTITLCDGCHEQHLKSTN